MIDIRTSAARMLKNDFQIDEKVTYLLFEKGIIKEHDIKKVLIKNEYRTKVQPKEKQLLRNKIAQKYCVSVSLVEKVVL